MFDVFNVSHKETLSVFEHLLSSQLEMTIKTRKKSLSINAIIRLLKQII